MDATSTSRPGTHRQRTHRIAASIALLMSLAGCGREGRLAVPQPSVETIASPPLSCVTIPEPDEWEYVGTALESGVEAEFDRLLWGGFGGSAIRVGDEILFYYQAARGYSHVQQSVSFRSIGLAVSRDGTRFVKDAASPVLEWSPTAGEEEGAASIAAAVGSGGEIVAFYGANTMMGPTSVSADARWAISVDGRTFEDRGIALDHRDRRIVGWGDELFPVIAFVHGAHWYVFYLPNGNGRPRGELAVAVGPRPDRLADTAAVRSGRRQVRAWGIQSAAHLCEHTYALFLNGETADTVTVRLIDARTPDVASEPVTAYRFPSNNETSGFSEGAVMLDRKSGYWYLYHRNKNHSSYAVRRAHLRTR